MNRTLNLSFFFLFLLIKYLTYVFGMKISTTVSTTSKTTTKINFFVSLNLIFFSMKRKKSVFNLQINHHHRQVPILHLIFTQ